MFDCFIIKFNIHFKIIFVLEIKRDRKHFLSFRVRQNVLISEYMVK